MNEISTSVSQSMEPSTERSLKSALMLFGSFAFGHNFSNIIHESGHALSTWASGGTNIHISLHPFDRPFVTAGTFQPSLLIASSGIVLETLLPLLLLLIIGPISSPYWMPLTMTLIMALLKDGVYLVFDTISQSRGDPTALARLGISKFLMIITGICMTCSGIAIAGVFSPLLGIRTNDSIRSRIIILEAGLLSYLCLGIVFRAFYFQGGVGIWYQYAAVSGIALFILGAISRTIQIHIPLFRIVDAAVIEWNHILFVVTLGILAIGLPILFY
jgi:hypothetical protein